MDAPVHVPLVYLTWGLTGDRDMSSAGSMAKALYPRKAPESHGSISDVGTCLSLPNLAGISSQWHSHKGVISYHPSPPISPHPKGFKRMEIMKSPNSPPKADLLSEGSEECQPGVGLFGDALISNNELKVKPQEI